MIARLFPFAICLGFVVGCADQETPPRDTKAENVKTATEQPSDEQKPSDSKGPAFTHRITEPTEYYKGGPQQAQPPDGQFKAETKVKLIEKAGSYSLVQSEDGVEAYVATGALAELEDAGNSKSD